MVFLAVMASQTPVCAEIHKDEPRNMKCETLKRSLLTLLMVGSLSVSSFGGIGLADDDGNALPEGARMTDGRDVYIIQHGLIHQMTKADIDEWFRVRHGQLRGKTLVMYNFDHQTIVRAQADAKARATKKSSDWVYATGGGTWAIKDSEGVIHYSHLEEERFNQATHDYDALLNGHWIHNPVAHGWVRLSYD
jgi:hypothetical protein